MYFLGWGDVGWGLLCTSLVWMSLVVLACALFASGAVNTQVFVCTRHNINLYSFIHVLIEFSRKLWNGQNWRRKWTFLIGWIPLGDPLFKKQIYIYIYIYIFFKASRLHQQHRFLGRERVKSLWQAAAWNRIHGDPQCRSNLARSRCDSIRVHRIDWMLTITFDPQQRCVHSLGDRINVMLCVLTPRGEIRDEEQTGWSDWSIEPIIFNSMLFCAA